ncbi:MAG TPA: DbpA RNA binding domain-containing protein, partial [Gillisia sp.]|nr:DbpA RNA binding domain-containing protein [Gillisia sp.]
SIQRVSDYLNQNQIGHGCFHGGMEQQDIERSLIKFRNGTHNIIVATDLAARGLDIPELNFIIHYQLPLKEEEFTHRNGRTARMNTSGNAYVIKWVKEDLPDFIELDELKDLNSRETPKNTLWETIFVSGGRKDKISKGDIAGLFFKQGKLEKDELGAIELKQDCCFVSVPAKKVQALITTLNNTKLKNKKVRVKLI